MQLSLNGAKAQVDLSNFTGALSVESSDPDALVTWLQGRSDISYRSKKPLRLQGNVTMASGRVAIESMKAELDGGGVEGRVELASRQAGGSRFDAELAGERVAFDAVAAVAGGVAGHLTEGRVG